MIDWTRVEELRNDMGRDAFDEVIELFLEEMEERLQLMKESQACAPDDLHFLKGCAANVGFSGLLALCAKAEADNDISFANIDNCYGKSKTEFLSSALTQGGYINTPDNTSSSVMSR